MFGRLYGVRRLRSRIMDIVADLDLTALLDRPAGKLSAGQKTRVALAKALLNQPAVLLLDEPTASLDPDTADWVRTYLETYQRETGATVLLASHNMAEVERLCSQVLMMREGRIVDRGSPEDLIGPVRSADPGRGLSRYRPRSPGSGGVGGRDGFRRHASSCELGHRRPPVRSVGVGAPRRRDDPSLHVPLQRVVAASPGARLLADGPGHSVGLHHASPDDPFVVDRPGGGRADRRRAVVGRPVPRRAWRVDLLPGGDVVRAIWAISPLRPCGRTSSPWRCSR